MYRKSRIISMGAGAVLAAGASLSFGFMQTSLPGSVYMAVCLLGLALIYFPSRGLSEER
ncbi:hypothetical protein [Mordavella massiliensis]|uniref:Uncharacterized protein n=1 Tax=Mordavella massiliensis TaxID=1871024 RepID=A0A938XDH7_9CLOT|nr:hypothetical protein [Mordavella massiliensis]MBM6948167.1 hypothetical protein [Mordavella massiliensis]